MAIELVARREQPNADAIEVLDALKADILGGKCNGFLAITIDAEDLVRTYCAKVSGPKLTTLRVAGAIAFLHENYMSGKLGTKE